MRVAAFLLIFAASPGIANAQKPPTLQQQLTSELSGKTLQTKIVLRSMFSEAGRSGVWNYVETNVLSNGQMVFGLSGLFMVDQGGPIPRSSTCGSSPDPKMSSFGRILEGTLCWVDVGKSVLITDIHVARDHLTIGYWPSGRPVSYTSPAAKLNFIIGKDWQKTISFEQVMEVVADALVIERIERGRAIAKIYADLMQQEQALSPSQSDPLEKRLDDAQRLRDVLNKLIANRSEYERLGKDSVAQELAGYTSRIRDLDVEVPRLQEEIKKGRIDRILSDIATAEAEALAFRSALDVVPKSEDDLKRADDVLVRLEFSLGVRERLAQALSSLDAGLAATRKVVAEAERDEIRKRRADLDRLTPKIALTSVNSSYLRLKSEESRRKAAYVAAFDTPGRSGAATEFRKYLQAMIDNRETAARLGEAAAPEIQRLRALIATIK